MSDVVVVALISAGSAIIVAIITQAATIWNANKAANSGNKLLKKYQKSEKENQELREVVDYLRKKDVNK